MFALQRAILPYLYCASAGVILLCQEPVFANMRRAQEPAPVTAWRPLPGTFTLIAGKPAQTIQLGEASWYGPGFQGKVTASGEVYDQHDLTAALPVSW